MDNNDARSEASPSPSSGSRSRTFSDRMASAALIINALTQTFIAIFTAPFRGSSGSKWYIRHVLFTGFRTLFSGGYLLPITSTDREYAAFVKSHRIEGRTLELKDGTKGHWLGDQDAQKTVVFFHELKIGGGYVLPATVPHYSFCWNLVNAAKEKGKKLKVIVVSYELSPKVRYPHHLAGAVNIINHLINIENISPSDILLVGDSSGGHMVLGLLSHALHPHPDITPLSISGQKFATAIAHSPKVSASPVRTADSITRNKYKDFSSAEGLIKVNADFLGPEGKPDGWNSWLKADNTIDETWWDGLDGLVESILVAGGSDEIYIDDIIEVGETIKAAHEDAVLFVGPDEPHDSCIMDYALGWTGKSESPRVVKEWVLKYL